MTMVMEKSRKEQFTEQAVHYFIYQLENPDWFGLQQELLKIGYTYGEVYEILREVREGGY